MAPKIDAACRFVEQTGGEAAIGALAELEAIAAHEAGTRVVSTDARAGQPSSP